MIVALQNKNKIVASYELKTKSSIKFKVNLLETDEGNREFDIIVEDSNNEDYSEIFSHDFYKDVVMPWIRKEKEIEKRNYYDNVIPFKPKNNINKS